MRHYTEKSKGAAALEMVGRSFMVIIVLFGTATLADGIHRGVIKGRHGAFAVQKSDEPALFWLLVVAGFTSLAVLGYAAVRGFNRKSKQ